MASCGRPEPARSYRALYKLYFDARAYDKAWCIARTLTYFQKADEEQQKFYQQYKQDREIQPKTRLSNENWVKDLMHTDQDIYISQDHGGDCSGGSAHRWL